MTHGTGAAPLRIWCDPAESRDWDLVSMVQPVAWSDPERATPYQQSVVGAWQESCRELIELTALTDSEVAVLPFGLEAVDALPDLWPRAVELAQQSMRAGRLMLVFCHGDRYIPAPADNCVMLRTSLHRSRMSPRDVPLPAWVSDPDLVVPVTSRPFSPTPAVGFTGQAYPLGMQGRSAARKAAKWAKWLVRSAATAAEVEDVLRIPPDGVARVGSLLALRHSHRVTPQIVIREAMTRLDLDAEEDRERHREFLCALRDADYGLAVSGLGNYSYRLYETLAMGRPAVLVDTDIALPGADRLPWDRMTIRIPLRQVPRLGHLVSKEHRRRGPAHFAEAQAISRQTWRDELSADGFLRRVTAVLKTSLRRPGAPSPAPFALAERLR